MLQVSVQRWRSTAGQHLSRPVDPDADLSGWTPEALHFLIQMGTELPSEIASRLCQSAGHAVSRAELDRLIRSYSASALEARRAQLDAQAFEPLAPASSGTGRVMVMQLDGCVVSGQPQQGRCMGMEVKAVCVYPQQAPSVREIYAEIGEAQQFASPCAGLLRSAGLRQGDVLVGLGDGAAWVMNLFLLLGAIPVLDVFHGVMYLDTVMQQLGWSEQERGVERAAWLRGSHAARDWLHSFVPSAEQRVGWTPEALVAVRYLEARIDLMDYPTYRERHWPIGSGQIEGINKSVIGHRLKRAGQHWSRSGAAGMAALRAGSASSSRPLQFHPLRHRAFPVPHF